MLLGFVSSAKPPSLMPVCVLPQITMCFVPEGWGQTSMEHTSVLWLLQLVE